MTDSSLIIPGLPAPGQHLSRSQRENLQLQAIAGDLQAQLQESREANETLRRRTAESSPFLLTLLERAGGPVTITRASVAAFESVG